MHNKIAVCEVVELNSEFWREQCKALHSSEHDKISFDKVFNKIKDDVAKGENFNYERHVNLCHVNENIASIEVMCSWIKKLDS